MHASGHFAQLAALLHHLAPRSPCVQEPRAFQLAGGTHQSATLVCRRFLQHVIQALVLSSLSLYPASASHPSVMAYAQRAGTDA